MNVQGSMDSRVVRVYDTMIFQFARCYTLRSYRTLGQFALAVVDFVCLYLEERMQLVWRVEGNIPRGMFFFGKGNLPFNLPKHPIPLLHIL